MTYIFETLNYGGRHISMHMVHKVYLIIMSISIVSSIPILLYVCIIRKYKDR